MLSANFKPKRAAAASHVFFATVRPSYFSDNDVIGHHVSACYTIGTTLQQGVIDAPTD